jgi:Transposase DDE domain
MRRGKGPAVQGYNAQALIDAGKSGLIVGAHLCDAPNDVHQLQPGLQALAKEAGQPGVVLADKGYDNTEQIARIEAEKKVLVLCRPQKRANALVDNPHRRGRHKWKWQRRRLMEERLASAELRKLYCRRQPCAAPKAFGVPGLNIIWASSVLRCGEKERPLPNGCWCVWRIIAGCWPQQKLKANRRSKLFPKTA